ncbi:hypothetical protein BD413DRAFT_174778 [Trametes elegans]|nr:hypothetical protein BD413DRAFT_174778 [Trametes elegans]
MMLQESRMAHEKQLEIAHAANEVGSALEELTERMHVEIQQINGTASALEESLLRAGSRDWNMMAWSWLETASVYCFKYIWRDPTYLDTPAVRVALLFSRVLWSFMTLASSGLMVCVYISRALCMLSLLFF